jgi:hypothetical protein
MRIHAAFESFRSKKRAAMRSAPVWSPAAQAARILSVFVARITSTALHDARENSSLQMHRQVQLVNCLPAVASTA